MKLKKNLKYQDNLTYLEEQVENIVQLVKLQVEEVIARVISFKEIRK